MESAEYNEGVVLSSLSSFKHKHSQVKVCSSEDMRTRDDGVTELFEVMMEKKKKDVNYC